MSTESPDGAKAMPLNSPDLATLQSHLASILDSVPDGMIVIDETGRIVAFSRAAEALFGYTAAEIMGRNVRELMAGRDESNHDKYIQNYLQTGERRIIGIGRVVTARKADGTLFTMDLKIGEAKIGDHWLFTAFVRDLTEQRKAEMRMREMQSELVHFSRLSAVGTMASALAHELNQPLTAVANYLEAGRDLLDRPGDDSRETLREAMDEGAKQAVRAGDIVRKLRGYVSRGEIDGRSVDLGPLLNDATALARLSMNSSDVPILLRVAPGLENVIADPIQIQQVVINLVRNAQEALTRIASPQISIEASPGPQGFVSVSVIDNGPGLDPEVQSMLFKPFTTSKSGGMGLGLSICQTIVEAHGGTISAENVPGGGTCFRFTLRVDPAIHAS
ncbi:MAG: PAS domain S-box protein [Hyphomonas oceanitis]|uniref:Sensor protein FixL n=1 Tax=Hyphomonas oceanitis SCH89 TaxID=1280953 RepID=A0A059G5H2_9PROT|nr:PAS domain-containing sensor histidine kinase [Hyphomonas oceanitis]KDA02066.1 sensory box sensor histidine kinase FixL [Hyphomonas oceanitis SCH89]